MSKIFRTLGQASLLLALVFSRIATATQPQVVNANETRILVIHCSAIPEAVTYRFDDLASAANLLASTTIAPDSKDVRIEVPASAFATQVATYASNPQDYEWHVLTALVQWTGGAQTPIEYRFLVRRLAFMPTPQ